MGSARKFYGKFRASDGRIKLAALFGFSSLLATVALLVGVLPAIAGDGDPTDLPLNVQPIEVAYGGGSGACSANIPGRLPSAAGYELHINNPASTTYIGPDGTEVKLIVDDQDKVFSFEFLNMPQMAAFDVVVNGGRKSAHFDYDDHLGPGPARKDQPLHAPTKGGSGNLYRLSHINICYDVKPLADVSGFKFHDRDTDGLKDETEEEGLGGWTFTAFQDGAPVSSSDPSSSTDGSYTIEGLAPGDYIICEMTTTGGLELVIGGSLSGPGFDWSWRQSDLSVASWGEYCGFDGYEAQGHAITVDSDITDIDFGNHTQVAINCDGGDVVVILGGSGSDDNPYSTVTIPEGTASCSGGEVWTTTYEVGRSDRDGGDPDLWTQFVFFGDEDSPTVPPIEAMTQVIVWDVEQADYQGGSLVVPTTNVLLPSATTPGAIVLCSAPPGYPTVSVPVCLDSRTIAEGGLLAPDFIEVIAPGFIQVIDVNKLFGDPGFFR